MLKKKIKVSNSKYPNQFFEEDFWVDTGALYSFIPEDYLFLLGATALENFGVDVDPIQKKLKPILAVIGGFIASQ